MQRNIDQFKPEEITKMMKYIESCGGTRFGCYDLEIEVNKINQHTSGMSSGQRRLTLNLWAELQKEYVPPQPEGEVLRVSDEVVAGVPPGGIAKTDSEVTIIRKEPVNESTKLQSEQAPS